jgi:hypothetical protein
MTVLSSRYATPVLVLLALALVPTVVNSYVGRKVVEAPALREALPEVLDGSASQPTARKASSIKKEFDSEDWVERAYMDAGGRRSVVLAVRSYDMKRLYHHPELAVALGQYERQRVISVPSAGGTLDLHVLEGEDGNGLVAYALLYKGRTVANPLALQLLAVPELLLTGQRPMTLLFAEEVDYRPGATPLERSGAVRHVVAAVSAMTRP